MKRLSDRNRAIQEMLTSGEGLKTFYRFVANNPHIALHDACQIVIERPSASICFSFEEWNAQGRRVTKGRKGIPYYDNDGSKRFVFDVSDTHGDKYQSRQKDFGRIRPCKRHGDSRQQPRRLQDYAFGRSQLPRSERIFYRG